jgi:AraC-like DNA-binding protein
MKIKDSKILNIKEFGTEIGCQISDAVFFVLKGSFSLTVGDKTELVGENELAFFPGDMHFERRVKQPLSFYYVKLEGSNGLPRGKVGVENPIRMLSTFHLLHSSVQKSETVLANHFLNDVFFQIKAEKSCSSKSYDRLTNEVINYFKENYRNKITLKDLKSALGASSTGIIEHFKENVGSTPFSFLNSMRVAICEELLVTGDLTLAEIAAKCGFDNPFYLSNVFKKEKGISPREYRKLYRV